MSVNGSNENLMFCEFIFKVLQTDPLKRIMDPYCPEYLPFSDALVPKICKHCHQSMELKQINLTVAVRQCYKCPTPLEKVDLDDIQFFHRSYKDVHKDPKDWCTVVDTEERELNILQTLIKNIELSASKYNDCSDDDESGPKGSKVVNNSYKLANESSDVTYEDYIDCLVKNSTVDTEDLNSAFNSSAMDELEAALEKMSKAPTELDELPFSLEDLFPPQPDLSIPISSSSTDFTELGSCSEIIDRACESSCNPHILEPASEENTSMASSLVSGLGNLNDGKFQKEEVPVAKQHQNGWTFNMVSEVAEMTGSVDNSCDQSLDIFDSVRLSAESLDKVAEFADKPAVLLDHNILCYSRRATATVLNGNKGSSRNPVAETSKCVKSVIDQDYVRNRESYELPSSDECNQTDRVQIKLPVLSLSSLRGKEIDDEEDFKVAVFPSDIEKVLFSPCPLPLKNHISAPSRSSLKEIEVSFSIPADGYTLEDHLCPEEQEHSIPQENTVSGMLITVPAEEDITPEMLPSIHEVDLPILFESSEVTPPSSASITTMVLHNAEEPVLVYNAGDPNNPTPSTFSFSFGNTPIFSLPSKSVAFDANADVGYSEDDVLENSLVTLSTSEIPQSSQHTSKQCSQSYCVTSDDLFEPTQFSFGDALSVSGTSESISTISSTDCATGKNCKVEDDLEEAFDELKSFTGTKFKPKAGRKIPSKKGKDKPPDRVVNLMAAIQNELDSP